MSRKNRNEVTEIWNANAAFWDSRMGEGNDFHKILLEPNQLEMLDIKKGDLILDIACGNGQFARKMAGLGAEVTAIDGAEEFIKIDRTKPLAEKINYQVIDVTDPAELNKLNGNIFDAAICTMALMDIENIEPLIGFLPSILKKKGIFVFSILHPCLNSGEYTLVHERNDLGGTIHDNYYVKISNYLKSQALKGLGMVGQPKAQWYFHRPLCEYFKVCFDAGFCLVDLREPAFEDVEPKSLFNNVFKSIPPSLICSFKLAD
jgi:2-polyprenyl-3-methyl-5-hydroxy-6-metoxy-1,4-benzoquinol methylase